MCVCVCVCVCVVTLFVFENSAVPVSHSVPRKGRSGRLGGLERHGECGRWYVTHCTLCVPATHFLLTIDKSLGKQGLRGVAGGVSSEHRKEETGRLRSLGELALTRRGWRSW